MTRTMTSRCLDCGAPTSSGGSKAHLRCPDCTAERHRVYMRRYREEGRELPPAPRRPTTHRDVLIAISEMSHPSTWLRAHAERALESGSQLMAKSALEDIARATHPESEIHALASVAIAAPGMALAGRQETTR